MANFSAKLKVWNPVQPGLAVELDVMVDTGAAYSWIARSRLQTLGIQPLRKLQFRTIEGKLIERELAPVFIAADGYTGGDTVVFAEQGDMEVLGAHSLESLGLAADPVQKKLIPTVMLAL